jgi:hypothetical protein
MKYLVKHIINLILFIASSATLMAQPVAPPVIRNSSLCSITRDSITLYAKPTSTTLNEKIVWYTNASTTTPYAVRDSNLRVFDTTTVTYYASTLVPGDTAVYDTFVYSNPTLNVNSAYYTSYFDGQVFDVFDTLVLESVSMYFNNMFNVVVVIRDNLGNVVSTTNVPNPTGVLNGQTEVFLRVRLEPGISYTITAEGSGGNGILRNYADAVYPYRAISAANDTLFAVTGTVNGLTNYLYFFYDWKIFKVSNDRVSPRLPVKGWVNTQPIIGYFSRKVCQDTSITLNAAVNAVSPTYLWSNTSTTSQIVVNQRGLYGVTVTIPVDTFPDCVRTWQVQVDTFPRTFITVLDTSYLSCAGDTADNIDIKLKGGKLPYNVYWSDDNNPGTSISTTLGTSDSLTGLVNARYGSYTVLVTDFNGCKATLPGITISEPDPLSIQLNYLDSIVCNGEPTGKLEAVLGGGREPYQYEWRTVGGAFLHGDSLIASNLQPDNYLLALQDNNGCLLNDTIAVDFIAGSLPLNYDQERNTSFGANASVWSAFVIFDDNKLTPYYDNYFIEYVSAYISDEDTNIVEAILRIRRDVNDAQRPFIAGSNWTKVHEQNVTDKFKGINGFKCVRLNNAGNIVLERGHKYIVEIEFVMKDGSVQVLGLDAGVQPDPNGAWIFNSANPNGTPLSSLGAFNRNWNIRLTVRDVIYTGVDEVILGNSTGLTCYPNPGSNQVNWAFTLSHASQVSLAVYDLQGRKVAQLADGEWMPSGASQINWNSADVPVGMYIGILQAGNDLFTTKLLIVR